MSNTWLAPCLFFSVFIMVTIINGRCHYTCMGSEVTFSENLVNTIIWIFQINPIGATTSTLRRSIGSHQYFYTIIIQFCLTRFSVATRTWPQIQIFWCCFVASAFSHLSERAVQEMRRQGLSFSTLQTSSSLSVSSSSHHISPDRSILRSLDHSTDKSSDK